MVRVVLFLHFIPGIIRFLLIFMASTEVLNVFLKQVVGSLRDLGIRKWVNWLREDLGSRYYAWLRPDFVPPPPVFVVKDPQTGSSRISFEPHHVDVEFREAWVPFFCRSGYSG